MNWIRSSHCGTDHVTECVEVAFAKSSYSATTECVEVGHGVDVVLVRDSKDPDGPVLSFTVGEWTAFLAGVDAGEFRRP